MKKGVLLLRCERKPNSLALKENTYYIAVVINFLAVIIKFFKFSNSFVTVIP